MFKRYLHTAFKILIKEKWYSLVNISILTLGITFFLLTVLYIKFELSYEKSYKDYESIFRICVEANEYKQYARCPYIFKHSIGETNNDIEYLTQLMPIWGNMISTEENSSYEFNIFFTDENIFPVFSLKILKGDTTNILKKPHTLVLSDKMAKKYFANEDPIGQQINIDGDTTPFTICAIVEDLPPNSHFKCDFYLSMITIETFSINSLMPEDYLGNYFNTYFKLKKGVDRTSFESKLPKIKEHTIKYAKELFPQHNLDDYIENFKESRYFIEPIKDIHLRSTVSNSEFGGSSKTQYINTLAIVSLIVIILTILNHINIAGALTMSRIEELYIRHAIGASRGQILLQILFETLVFVLISTYLAIGVIEIILPYISETVGKELDIFFKLNLKSFSFLFVFCCILTCLTALPSAFHILNMLAKGNILKGYKRNYFRETLGKMVVAVQIILAIIIGFGAIVSVRHLYHIYNVDVSMDKENTLVLYNYFSFKGDINSFREEVKKNKDILAMGSCNYYPGPDIKGITFSSKTNPKKSFEQITVIYADMGSSDILNFDLIAGKMPNGNSFNAKKADILVNETLAKMISKNPIGESLVLTWNDTLYEGKISGIVKDFHTESTHSKIKPTIFLFFKNKHFGFGFIRVKLGKIKEVNTFIKDLWYKYNKEGVFTRPLDELWAEMYIEEQKTSYSFLFFSLFAFLIVITGLIGIVSYTTIKKSGEIAIKKALGANDSRLLFKLSFKSIIIFSITIIIGIIPAYFFVNYWANTLSNNVTIGILDLALTISIAIALLSTTTIITIKHIIKKDPAAILRYE